MHCTTVAHRAVKGNQFSHVVPYQESRGPGRELFVKAKRCGCRCRCPVTHHSSPVGGVVTHEPRVFFSRLTGEAFCITATTRFWVVLCPESGRPCRIGGRIPHPTLANTMLVISVSVRLVSSRSSTWCTCGRATAHKKVLCIHSRTAVVPSLPPSLPLAASGRGVRDRAVLLWHPGVRECSRVLPGQL